MDQFTSTILRRAALPTAVVGVIAAGVAFATGGADAAAGALLGATVVVVFFMIGQLVLAAVLRRNPMMGMTVAMLLYLVKIGVLLAMMLGLQGVTAFDTKAFAFTILVCTLTWTAAEVWIFSTSKVLYVEPDNVPADVQEFSDHSRR